MAVEKLNGSLRTLFNLIDVSGIHMNILTSMRAEQIDGLLYCKGQK